MIIIWFHSGNISDKKTRVPLATTIGGVAGETDIPEMWQDHYKSILNSVSGNFQQHFVSSKINSISEESILFSTSDINIALHSLKCGKSCGVDGLAADHFKYAHRISHVFLSLLFNSFISHGYLPTDFMKTALVPIVNYKQNRRH